MTRPRLLLILISFFFLPNSEAQQSFILTNYSTENGLPSNGIKGMQWNDANQFLWLATEAGIARFNGVSFKIFDTKEDFNEETSPRMKFMVRNHDGEIISCNKKNKIYSIHENQVEFEKSLTGKKIKNQDLFIFLSSSRKMLQLYDSSIQYCQKERKIINLAFTQDTICYFLTDSVIYRLSPSFCSQVSFTDKQGAIINLFRIGEHVFARNSANKFFKLNPGQNLFSRVGFSAGTDEDPGTFDAKDMIFWENGMEFPILIFNQCAWKLKESLSGISTEKLTEGIPENTLINYLQYSERLKTLFIGSNSQGLFVITPRYLTQVHKEGKSTNERTAYYGQLELPEGSILTDVGHIIKSKNNNSNVKAGIPEGYFSFYRVSQDEVWYVRRQGPRNSPFLFQNNLTTGKIRSFPAKDFDENAAITQFMGNVYIINNRGVCKLEEDTFRYLYRKYDPENIFYNIEYWKENLLLITSCKALMTFDLGSRRLDTLLTTGEHCIRTSKIIGRDILVGTYGKGIYMYRNGQIKLLNADKNDYLLFAHCFMVDSLNMVWISTNRGLFRTRLDGIIKSFDGNTEIFYQYFGKSDGLEITELNGGCQPCALRMKNGKYSFPSMDGLVWFKPEDAVLLTEKARLFADEIRTKETLIIPEKDSTYSFPSDASEIEISLGYPAWSHRENIYIDYRLNENEAWMPVRNKDKEIIRLSNLPPGSYRMAIRMRNGFEANDYSLFEMNLIKEAPWYQTTSFYLISFLLLISLTIGIVKRREKALSRQQARLQEQISEKTKELLEKNEALENTDTIKTRLISIISHDMITPLKFVTVAGKKLLEKKSAMPEDLQNETIREITRTSQELQLLSTNILNWIKYQNKNRKMAKETFSLFEVTDQLFRLLQSMSEAKNIKLENSIGKELKANQYLEPFRILLYNLILNAINFSDKGKVTVSAHVSGQELRLSVADEGVGMTSEQIENILSEEFIISSSNVDNKKGNGLGYLIIKDLLHLIGGHLNIQSEPAKGTNVELFIPLI